MLMPTEREASPLSHDPVQSAAHWRGRSVNVLLADDDPHVRSAVRLLLQDEPGIALVAECATADGLVERVLCSRPDVVLVDWDLPGLPAASVLQRLRATAPACQVVVLSGRPEDRAAALRAGAASFVCKGDAPDSLLAALQAVRTG
jgi:DNA-binding NarL/FixJ family response regulator